MSESFAVLRQRRSDELAKLADEHMQHDLYQSDRDALKDAASKVSLWTTVGSAVGIGLGLFVAMRLRSTRKALFQAFRAQEKPTQVVFPNGRTESIPDVTPLLRPTMLGDFGTYFLASAGGLFIGGELGMRPLPSIILSVWLTATLYTGFLIGASSGSRNISADHERKKRVENAFRRFRVDMLRKEADALEREENVWDKMF
ncbi:hypothetical protein BDV59DRAFT_175092 [Aspergillus ambiguus]|uniref:uncharacterized protein n=1 Tax=Aspergillus ambiguus TaxID=176160 RepID=UPI003CCD019E